MNHSRKFALQQQNVERQMRVVNVVSGALGCHIFLKLDKILSVTCAARLIGISPPCPRVATLPGHQKSRPCLGLRGVGQGGHPFLKSIIKIRRNRRSFHFTPATLAMPATFTSMGQRSGILRWVCLVLEKILGTRAGTFWRMKRKYYITY